MTAVRLYADALSSKLIEGIAAGNFLRSGGRPLVKGLDEAMYYCSSVRSSTRTASDSAAVEPVVTRTSVSQWAQCSYRWRS